MFQTKFILFFSLLISVFNANSQEKIINWDVQYNSKTSEIIIKADIKKGWHLYSQNIDANVGPIPTEFTFDKNDDIEFIGKVIEEKPIRKYDSSFEAELDYFEGQVVFIQKTSKISKNTDISGNILFMVCDDTMCLPPDVHNFKINITK